MLYHSSCGCANFVGSTTKLTWCKKNCPPSWTPHSSSRRHLQWRAGPEEVCPAWKRLLWSSASTYRAVCVSLLRSEFDTWDYVPPRLSRLPNCQVPGKFVLKGHDRVKDLSSLNVHNEDQYFPRQKRDVTYVSRLQV